MVRSRKDSKSPTFVCTPDRVHTYELIEDDRIHNSSTAVVDMMRGICDSKYKFFACHDPPVAPARGGHEPLDIGLGGGQASNPQGKSASTA